MNAAASAANPLTTDINDQPPWSDDMTNQGNPVLCEETGRRQAPHQPKRQQLHITEDFTSDEKTSIQAKGLARPDTLPAPGKSARRDYEYTRNGTMNLFAALRVHTGETHAMTCPTRNSQDLIRFLDEIDDTIPPAAGRQIIAIMDNLSTHKSKETKAWLKTHPHWRFVHTPNHASWLNQVECFFGILCRQLLKHGHFDTPQDLAEQMLAYIETRNQTATPFHWTYTGKVLNA
jgi:DDE superfamily endonuclease